MGIRDFLKRLRDFFRCKTPSNVSEAETPKYGNIPLSELQDDARHLLEFVLSRYSGRVIDELIESTARLTHADADGKYPELTHEQAATLWKNYDDLTLAAYPATAESIKIQYEIKKQSKAGKEKNIWQTLIPKWVRWTPLGLTILVILLQIYILALSNTLENIALHEAKYTELTNSFPEDVFPVKNENGNSNLTPVQRQRIESYNEKLGRTKTDRRAQYETLER